MKSIRNRGLRRTAAALATAAMVLAACGGDSSDTDTGAATTASPDSGGDDSTDTTTGGGDSDGSGSSGDGVTVTLGDAIGPNTLDPATAASGGDYNYLYLLYDRLVHLAPGTLDPVPGLAVEWEYQDADELEFYMKLREGVTFHDGTPFDAEAVKTSLERHIEIGSLTPIRVVDEIEVLGEHEILLRLTSRFADLPLALADAGGMIVSKAAIEADPEALSNNPVGTGPYRIAAFEAGASVELERFADYWNFDPSQPEFLEWELFSSDVALVNALRAGQIDGGIRIPAFDVETLDTQDGMLVSATPSLAFILFYYNTASEPMDDVLVRQAFNFALDRESIASIATEDIGGPMTQPFPIGSEFFIEDLETWTFDPERAASLLADAGYPDGIDLQCTYLPGSVAEASIPVIIDSLSQAGIRLQVQERALSEAIAEFWVEPDGPPCFASGWVGMVSPHATLTGVFGADSFYNASKEDFGIADLLEDFVATSDIEERRAVVTDITTAVTDAAAYAPMYNRPLIFALSEEFVVDDPNLFNFDMSSIKVR